MNTTLCARAVYAMYLERMDKEPGPMNADFASQIAQGFVRVAMAGDVFAGYVVFYPEDDHLHLESVVVAPSQSGQGIGKRLVEYVESAGRGLGLHAVEPYMNEVMTENQAIYSKQGYVEKGKVNKASFNRFGIPNQRQGR